MEQWDHCDAEGTRETKQTAPMPWTQLFPCPEERDPSIEVSTMRILMQYYRKLNRAAAVYLCSKTSFWVRLNTRKHLSHHDEQLTRSRQLGDVG
jgi:hypothetical protein